MDNRIMMIIQTTKREYTGSQARSAKAMPIFSAGNTRDGFTLVETLIAISILLLSLAGPLTIVSRGLVSASFARDQVTASFLAQEAAEIIRNVRDSNALNDSSAQFSDLFGDCLGESCNIDGTKDIDDSDLLKECSSACEPLKYDTISGLYGHNPSWEDSKFTRSVFLSQINSNEFSLTVTISWNNGPISKTFVVQENLYDWQ